MTNYPDFYNYGYRITRELGHNRAGGRVTYLATEVNTDRSVVIKQFQFANMGGTWSEYQSYESEIKVLKELNHPQIPRYLDSFQTVDGFCMVQEYKNALSLVNSHRLKPQQIKQIALKVLEILQYLQNRVPPIIHRDLKPDNILVDEQLNVYLVDFGFARIGGGEVAASSVVKGTLGFMPPEQMFNRELTVSSDLYSLGATLICLLAGVNSAEVGSLMDETGSINFDRRLAGLNPPFVKWLKRMVEPNYLRRYSSAKLALNELVPLEIMTEKNPNFLTKNVVKFGLLLASLGILIPVGSQFFVTGKPVNVDKNVIIDPSQLNKKVMFTTELGSTQNVENVLINSRVYFAVNLTDLPDGEYDSLCRIFDGNGRLVIRSRSILQASNNQLNTWCWYQLDSKQDKPGNWRFEFYLNDQKVVEKVLKVVKKN